MPHAIVAAGTGRYSDPWHPFVSTSRLIAEALEADGWTVTLEDDLDSALAGLGGAVLPDRALDLDGADHSDGSVLPEGAPLPHGVVLPDAEPPDLLVVNAGDPWRNGETGHGAPDAAVAGLRAALDRGIGILAVHNAVSTLRDYPEWRSAIGGAWIEGRSFHPEISEATVRVLARHPVTARVTTGETGAFRLFDERYTDLAVDADVTVLAVHEHEGRTHPLVWTHEYGATRAVVSALGHDERSFASPEHVDLLRGAARWAARLDAEG
ncbi:ThuA domain-containing protein [Micromonospora sp. DT81.3]|uniref:ThuA domain-containing protein n=1 Tax=Actinomycetes TaxID=1760 RepID=UPI003CF27675